MKSFIRSVLLLFSFIGILTSVFWDFIFVEETEISKACPFSNSVLAKKIRELPKLEHSKQEVFLESLCDSCISIENEVYDVGTFTIFFPSRILSSEIIGRLFSENEKSNDHVKIEATKLIESKFKHVGKLVK